MYVITIQVPEIPTGEWLRSQIRKLQIFTYCDPSGVRWPYVETYDKVGDALDLSDMPLVLLAAVDSVAYGRRCTVFRHVVFEEGNVAYVSPEFYRDGGRLLDAPIGPNYREGSERTSWAVGLVELARSLAGHVQGLEAGQAEQVGRLLDSLGALAPCSIAVNSAQPLSA